MSKILKKIIRILVVLVVLGGGAVGVWLYYSGRPPANPDLVRVNGTIEATEVDVSFKLSGVIVRLPVEDGMRVVKDKTVVAVLEHRDLLDQRDAVAAKLKQAKANLAAAQAALKLLLAGTRPEAIAQAEAKVREAKSNAWQAWRTWRRFNPLYKRQVISGQDRDQAKAKYQAAQAAVSQAQDYLLQLKNGARPEEIERARAQVKGARAAQRSAQAELKLVKTRIGYAKIMAPLTGYVLIKNVEAGEFVTAGTPICTIGDLDVVKFITYVPETQLARIKLGNHVTLTVDTYPHKKYVGKIIFISSQAEFTPKNVQTQAERVKLVYKVKVRLINPNQELKPGMPADGVIDTVTGPAAKRAGNGSPPKNGRTGG
jgi:HlyD family secretion protein